MDLTADELDIIIHLMELHDGEFCLTAKERIVYEKLKDEHTHGDEQI